MPPIVDILLPSPDTAGLWLYWTFAAVALLEAVVLTGVLIPGMVVILTGGLLVQRGAAEFTDLAWFIAAGTFAGTEVSHLLGRLAGAELQLRRRFADAAYVKESTTLLDRHGGAALVLCRFRGPLCSFVPFVAGMRGMGPWRILGWNALSVLPYTLVLLAAGYVLGMGLAVMTASLPRSVVFGIGAAVLIGAMVYGWIRARHAMAPLGDIVLALIAGLGRLPYVARTLERHPRIAGFLAARFGTDQFLGLTATVLALLLIYVGVAYANSVYHFLGNESVIDADNRIANLLYAMRDDRLIAVLGWITTLGGRHGVLAMLAGVSLALVLARRYDLLGGLWLAGIGNQITVTLLKSFFGRERSALGYFVETSGSFPSGHAAGSVAVWAMMFYVAWRTRILSAGVAGALALVLAALIGLSRVYLVEHYISDVLNGYLIGGMWLILGIAFCEWRISRHGQHRELGWRRAAALASTGAAVAGAVAISSLTVSPLNSEVENVMRVEDDPAAMLIGAEVSPVTESISGTPRQRLNIAVTLRDPAALEATLVAAGWTPAPRPGPRLLARAVLADGLGNALPDPLVIPTFWDHRPSLMAFSRGGDRGGERLHLRFWDSHARTSTGDMILVGTLTSEAPLAWTLEDADGDFDGAAMPKALPPLVDRLRAAGLDVITP